MVVDSIHNGFSIPELVKGELLSVFQSHGMTFKLHPVWALICKTAPPDVVLHRLGTIVGWDAGTQYGYLDAAAFCDEINSWCEYYKTPRRNVSIKNGRGISRAGSLLAAELEPVPAVSAAVGPVEETADDGVAQGRFISAFGGTALEASEEDEDDDLQYLGCEPLREGDGITMDKRIIAAARNVTNVIVSEALVNNQHLNGQATGK
jgi:hypothetical protein